LLSYRCFYIDNVGVFLFIFFSTSLYLLIVSWDVNGYNHVFFPINLSMLKFVSVLGEGVGGYCRGIEKLMFSTFLQNPEQIILIQTGHQFLILKVQTTQTHIKKFPAT